jgi:hypothetical protein
MTHSQALVWMNSREALVFRFDREELEQAGLRMDAPFLKVAHRSGTLGAGRPAADYDFFDRVIDALRGVEVWSLASPNPARDMFVGYLDHYKGQDGHIARLRLRLAIAVSIDQPTDDALLALARRAETALERASGDQSLFIDVTAPGVAVRPPSTT